MISTPEDALALIATVCALPGNGRYLEDTEELVRSTGIAAAVARRNSPVLYRWLMNGFSYQGISDLIADAYIARHGNADWEVVARALADPEPKCPKLENFESYRRCAYRKAARTCGNLETLPSCPVPSLPLRKGSLNEQAFSLFLFIQARCEGDLVGFIDSIIRAASGEPDPVTVGREALLAAFGEVSGVSRKLLSMMFSTLLIGADPARSDWVAIGRSMVAIDSLVHNFLHRTGILAAYSSTHSYGQKCFGEGGCETIIRDLADRFDARSINPAYPPAFPRFVQYAIWRFCAQGKLDICNGRNIRDTAPCELNRCPLWENCSRVPLRLPLSSKAG
jgi:hypothetical protein